MYLSSGSHWRMCSIKNERVNGKRGRLQECRCFNIKSR
jgi:hypothetical protein